MKNPNYTQKVEITVSLREKSKLHFQVPSTAAFLLLHPFPIQACLCMGGRVILPKFRAIVYTRIQPISISTMTQPPGILLQGWAPRANRTVGFDVHARGWVWQAHPFLLRSSTLRDTHSTLEIPHPTPPSKFTVQQQIVHSSFCMLRWLVQSSSSRVFSCLFFCTITRFLQQEIYLGRIPFCRNVSRQGFIL